MSHSAMYGAVQAGLYPLEESKKDTKGDKRRAEAVEVFLNDWRSQCKRKYISSLTIEDAKKRLQNVSVKKR